MKIVFTGGGTAGHIFPIVAIIRDIKKALAAPEIVKFSYLGPKDDYGLDLLLQEGVKIKKICAGKIRRYFSFHTFVDLFKIPVGFFQSLWYLFFINPDIVFSKGGHGSFPVVFAARVLSIPIFLHESDVIPGLAAKIESKWATEIFTSFEKTEYFPVKKVITVGNPVREEILSGDKEEAKKIFGLHYDKPIILIVGGSQGAQCLNNLVLEVLPELLSNFEIIHQTGKKNYKQVKAEADTMIEEKEVKPYYHVFPFLEEGQLKHLLAVSDLIVSRAGSGFIFEIAATGKPAILIPLSTSAQDHQLKNGYRFAEAGGGEVITEENLRPHFFFERLKFLFSRPDILREMAEDSKNFARPKASKIIANYIIEYLAQVLV